MSSSQYGSTKALDNFKRVGGYCKIKVCDKFVNILGEKENNFDQKGNIVNEEIMAEIKQFLESFYQMILSEKKWFLAFIKILYFDGILENQWLSWIIAAQLQESTKS